MIGQDWEGDVRVMLFLRLSEGAKIVELAGRDVAHGRPVKNKEALANPEALKCYKGLEELRV